MTLIKIFGYGSLINKQSLLFTSPDARGITAAYVKSFKRSFSLWDEKGLTSYAHGSLRGQPYCALDIKKMSRGQVNGVVFTITASLDDLKKREHMYSLIKAEAFDFANDESLGEVLVFSGGHNDGLYDVDSPAQARYLGMCLAGAATYGQEFYKMFLATTYIGNQTLLKFPKLLKLGQNYKDSLEEL